MIARNLSFNSAIKKNKREDKPYYQEFISSLALGSVKIFKPRDREVSYVNPPIKVFQVNWAENKNRWDDRTPPEKQCQKNNYKNTILLVVVKP